MSALGDELTDVNRGGLFGTEFIVDDGGGAGGVVVGSFVTRPSELCVIVGAFIEDVELLCDKSSNYKTKNKLNK